ncbi:MAG: hypothetical protein A3I05_03715 [Deltaproteobacteria bacterium RIFCSPLOWO2_02_FULL_44_10]|nr:MAG: hypothetical protein A3C46_07825 [Deltaproteobacteria bacterium RIFCSPHIGHO2_02_FULL_44_16]OGQ47076.1 MAG: hypothetical protein A3I05_03715 [Deltaproteobacteria bacterium RIFCSPLOWO2_02_FULL_44_10]
MQNILKNFLFFFLLVSSASANTLKEKIQTVEQRYQSITSLSAHFTQQTYVELLEKTIERKGKLDYKKDGKIRIEYFSPSPKIYITSGNMLWVYVPGEPESLMEQELSDDIVPKEALSFLGGFGKLTKEFRAALSSEFKNQLKEPGRFALHLTPHSKKSPYHSLDALFTDEGLMKQLILNNKSGNKTVYFFSNIVTNKKLDETFFSRP